MRKTKAEKRQPMKEEICEWELDCIKPVSNQFKTTFYCPAIMECPFCRTTSAGNLVKPLLSLYGTEWRERGYGLDLSVSTEICAAAPREP
jgi:hypothetical protein